MSDSVTEVGTGAIAIKALDVERKEVYVEDQEEIVQKREGDAEEDGGLEKNMMAVEANQRKDQVEEQDDGLVKVEGGAGQGIEESLTRNAQEIEINENDGKLCLFSLISF